MQTYFLNETAVRTSVNYGINNIKVEMDLPNENEQRNFDNFSVLKSESNKSKIDIKINDVDCKNQNSNSYENKSFKKEENKAYNKNGEKQNLNSKELVNKNNIEKINDCLISNIGLKFERYKKIEITIPDNVIINDTILLDFLFDEDNKYLVDNIKINIGKGSKANFILHYYSDLLDSEINNFHNLLLETNIGDNSECNIICANLLDDNANSFLAFENTINENAKLYQTIIDLGGKNKISNYLSKLVGDCSYNDVKNIYLGAKNEIIDINYNIESIGKNTKCIIESQGALKDSAKKNFKGIIDFKEGSKKSIGKESENCLILSQKARSRSLPVLLCHEEDVNGEHVFLLANQI